MVNARRCRTDSVAKLESRVTVQRTKRASIACQQSLLSRAPTSACRD